MKPSDISTKAVATRIPMADYLKFLKEATDNGMSISDFLLLKIYGDNKQAEFEVKTVRSLEHFLYLSRELAKNEKDFNIKDFQSILREEIMNYRSFHISKEAKELLDK